MQQATGDQRLLARRAGVAEGKNQDTNTQQAAPLTDQQHVVLLLVQRCLGHIQLLLQVLARLMGLLQLEPAARYAALGCSGLGGCRCAVLEQAAGH